MPDTVWSDLGMDGNCSNVCIWVSFTPSTRRTAQATASRYGLDLYWRRQKAKSAVNNISPRIENCGRGRKATMANYRSNLVAVLNLVAPEYSESHIHWRYLDYLGFQV